jgi:hypothetical protein
MQCIIILPPQTRAQHHCDSDSDQCETRDSTTITVLTAMPISLVQEHIANSYDTDYNMQLQIDAMYGRGMHSRKL